MTKQPADEYEEFIAELVSNVKNSGRKISDLNYGPLNKLKGSSGQEHQIDVSFIDSSFVRPTLVLVECKRWKEKVDVSVAKVAAYNLKDLTGYDEYPDDGLGLIVTTSAFQAGTHRIAEFEGIVCQEVNHGPPYGFRYENIVQVAECDTIAVSDEVVAEIIKNS